jgi:exocyst complex component 2
MVLKVVQQYIALLSEFFALSDMAASPSNQTASDGLPAFLPAGSDSLTTSYYLIKLLAEMTDCVSEVVAMEVSPEATTGLHTLLETARWKFEGALCEVWLRGEYYHKCGPSIVPHCFKIDARIFFHLETWELNPSDRSTTLYLRRIHSYQKHITTVAYKLAGGLLDAQAVKQKPIPGAFSNKITKTFLDAIYAFLDGLVHLSSDESPVAKGLQKQAALADSTGVPPLFDLRKNVGRATLELITSADITR